MILSLAYLVFRGSVRKLTTRHSKRQRNSQPREADRQAHLTAGPGPSSAGAGAGPASGGSALGGESGDGSGPSETGNVIRSAGTQYQHLQKKKAQESWRACVKKPDTKENYTSRYYDRPEDAAMAADIYSYKFKGAGANLNLGLTAELRAVIERLPIEEIFEYLKGTDMPSDILILAHNSAA